MKKCILFFLTLINFISCNNPLGTNSKNESTFGSGHILFPIEANLEAFTISSAVAGDTQVILTWQESKNAKSYEIYYGTSSGDNNIKASMCSGSSLSCTVTGLTNFQHYFFIVRAKNNKGALDSSNELNATPLPIDTAPVAINITPSNGTEDVESIITLSYVDGQGDLATTCSVSSLSNISITTPCSCAVGICTVGVTGTSNYNGAVSFKYTVTANGLISNSADANFSLSAVNDAPTISNVSDQTIRENENTGPLVVKINDVDNSHNCVNSLFVTSSNTTLIDNSNIVLSGTAPDCTLTLTPKSNQNGATIITLSLSHGEATVTESFTLTVTPLFSPNSITGLQVWLDANDRSTLFQNSGCSTLATGHSGSIGCWTDKSGNLHHASMGNTQYQPRLNLSDNIGSVEFDGINDHFRNAHSFIAREVYIVYRTDSTLQQTSALGQLWGQYTKGHVAVDGRSNRGLWSFDGNAGQRASYSIFGNSLSAATAGSHYFPWTYNQFEIVRVVFTSNVHISLQYIGTLDNEVFAIGTHEFGGQISEILVYSDSLSNVNAQTTEGYLACKWNLQESLPIGHPYKTSCP